MGDDAALAINTFGTWVNNADTKIGILGTIVVALLVAIVRERERVAATLRAVQPATHDLVAVGFLAGSILAAAFASFFLTQALRPRRTSAYPSRFAFPHVATLPDLTGFEIYDPAAARQEAWQQAQMLASITTEKYAYFFRALVALVVGALAYVVWRAILTA